MINQVRRAIAVGMGAIALLGVAPQGFAATPTSATASHDGAHDFDFNLGQWRTHIERRLKPFDDPGQAVILDGLVSVRPIWGGRAQLEEIEADGSQGHWEGLTLFLYDPKAGQWSQSFANSHGSGFADSQALIGGFVGGRGELISSDTFEGKAILVRGTWSDITADSHRYEEDYSRDGGRTWVPVFLARLTRLAATAPKPAIVAQDGDHGFDFDIGRWRTRSSRLAHPLTGSTTWSEMDGATEVTPVWGGRGNLAVLKSTGPQGPLQLISLRMFDPTAKQWSLNFATSAVGQRSVPMVGEFKDRVGEFYDQEAYNGRTILVRFRMIPISPAEARSEQAFSADGGKTWETNWINRYTRLSD